jgi:hypothetical protein
MPQLSVVAAAPSIGDNLTGRFAVDVHEERITSRWVKVGRDDATSVERLGLSDVHVEKFNRGAVEGFYLGHKVRVIFKDLERQVIGKTDKPGDGGIVESGRCVDRVGSICRNVIRMSAALFRGGSQPSEPGTVKVNAVEETSGGIVGGCDEIDPSVYIVNIGNFDDVEVTRGEAFL